MTYDNVQHAVPQPVLQCGDVLQFAPGESLLQSADDVFGGGHADIRHDQASLQFLEDVLVDFATRGQVGEVVGEPAVALVQARAQAIDEAGLLFFVGFVTFAEHVYNAGC